MKNIIIGIVALAVFLLVGFFAFNAYLYKEKQADNIPSPLETLEKEVVGTVTAIDLNGVAFDGPALIELKAEVGEPFTIAVPSMGLGLCAAAQKIADVYDIAIGDVVSVRGTIDDEGRIVPCEDVAHYLRVVGEYVDSEAGFRFEYPKGPDGYRNKGEGFTFSEDSSFVSGVMLVNKEEDAAMEESTEPREGLPTIKVQVYTNPTKKLPAAWAEAMPRETNINLALSAPTETSVGGAKAVRFITDGLYAALVYVVTSGDHVILLRGEYIDTDSDIYRTFIDIVNTFEFIPVAD